MSLRCRNGTPLLALLVAAAFLGFTPAASAEISVSLYTDEASDLVMEDGVLQGDVDGYVLWVAEITGPDQQIAFKNTLPDCMELMAGKPYDRLNPDPGHPDAQRAFELREVTFTPHQAQRIITTDGNTIIIENLEIPRRGSLKIRYWARIAGMAHYLQGERPLKPMDAEPTQVIPIGDPLDPMSDRTTPNLGVLSDANTNIITSPNCCNQAKVVGENVRVVRSQGTTADRQLCTRGASGFGVFPEQDLTFWQAAGMEELP